MIERLHFHRGYSLRLHKSKPFINHGIISPQTWGHAISRSVTEGNAADDHALALLESFMAIAESFPNMIAEIIYSPSMYSPIWGIQYSGAGG
jgi:hypothetical protein